MTVPPKTMFAQVFNSGGSWEGLIEDVLTWINANPDIEVVSVSQSEAGRNVLDTVGTIVVWYRE